jgi:hypothetical protein
VERIKCEGVGDNDGFYEAGVKKIIPSKNAVIVNLEGDQIIITIECKDSEKLKRLEDIAHQIMVVV